MGFGLHASNTGDPSEVRNLRVRFFALVASLGAIAMGYDTAVIGGTMALDSFRRDYGLREMNQHARDTLQGNIVSAFQAGAVFGSLISFPMVEKVGRKTGVMIAAAVFLVGGAMMTGASGHMGILVGGRAIAGIGIGSVSLTIPVYIAEIAPPSIRGQLIGLFEIFSQGGSMLGFWMNYASSQTISDESRTQWVVPLSLQLVPGGLMIIGMFFCPESPRWLAKNDRWEDAEKSLINLRKLASGHAYIRNELANVRAQLTEERHQSSKLSKQEKFRLLFKKGTRNRVAIGLLLMICQNFTGVNVITYYSPRIFETLGITGTDTKLFATGFYGVAKTVGMLIFALIVAEKVGRRQGLIWGAFIGSLPMWYLGGYVMKADPAGAAARGNVEQTPAGYLAMVCVYLYGVIFCATWQGITWLYCSEIFPLEIRMLCVSLTTAMQWLSSFVVSRTTPYMISGLGYGLYMIFATLMVLMGFWAFFFIPETKGLTLEEMDSLFMNSMRKATWLQLTGKWTSGNNKVPESMSEGDEEKGPETIHVELKH